MTVKTTLWLAIIPLGFLILTGCDRQPDSPYGFRLPEGDSTQGREAFIANDCIKCHTVYGDPLPTPDEASDIQVVLGGSVTRVKTYGQLVTSIINPSHVIKLEYKRKYTDAEGNSLMPDFTSELTARELIDITQYLQGKYKITIPQHAYEYGYYP